MKKAWIAIIAVLLFCCAEENSVPEKQCEGAVRATIVDLSGLDGCGFVFELEDGTRLEPLRLFFCGTPPLPKEVTEDPLYNFEFTEGKEVFITYEVTKAASACMAATVVKITCISATASSSTPTGEL